MLDKFFLKFNKTLHKTQTFFSLRQAIFLAMLRFFVKLFLFPNSDPGFINDLLKDRSLLQYTNLFFPNEYENNDK